MKLQSIILAGGKSRRFGRDKALVSVNGVSMIEGCVKLLRSLNLEPAVVTEKGRKYPSLNCRIEVDCMPDKGPLGGILTAFTVFQDAAFLILTCDMPYMTDETLKALMKARDDNFSATIFHSPQYGFQPFPGIYGVSLKEHVCAQIAKNELSMQAFFASLSQVQTLSFSPSDPAFANINAEADLR